MSLHYRSGKANIVANVVHPGSTKMYHVLKMIYLWNNMKRDGVNSISKFLNC